MDFALQPRTAPGKRFVTLATRTAGGWLLNGRKIFGTMSPAAPLLEVSCRVREPQRGLRWAMAAVPPETPGCYPSWRSQPATAAPISSGESSWMKWLPRTVTSIWCGQLRQNSR